MSSLFVCLFTRRVRWSIYEPCRALDACWTQREESSWLRIKKNLADDGHIINGFSVGLELICSDYCPLKGSLFLEAIDASISHSIAFFSFLTAGLHQDKPEKLTMLIIQFTSTSKLSCSAQRKILLLRGCSFLNFLLKMSWIHVEPDEATFGMINLEELDGKCSCWNLWLLIADLFSDH